MTSQTDEKGRPMTYWGGKTDESCPHVSTSKGGTSHCTLAASEIDRHLAEIDRLRVDREAEMEGLWRIIEGHLAEIDRLKRQVEFWSNEYKRLAEAGVERLRDFGVECDPASVMVEAAQYRLSKIEKE